METVNASDTVLVAQWFLADTTADSIRVEVQAPGGVVSVETLDATAGALSNGNPVHVPFNVAVSIRLTTRAADGRTSEPIEEGLVTPPQPVGSVQPELGNIGATWSPVAASTYRVVVSNLATGYQETFEVSGTSFVGPDGCALGSHGDPIEIVVTSINSAGQISDFPSAPARTNLICLG